MVACPLGPRCGNKEGGRSGSLRCYFPGCLPQCCDHGKESEAKSKLTVEPRLFEPKSPLPGNEILPPETKAPKRLRTDQRDHCRDMTPRQQSRQFGVTCPELGNLRLRESAWWD